MKIAVVGTGYVGLVAGNCFADSGNQVICVDIDKAKIDKLKKGIPVIYEPGLEDLLARNLKEKRISFITDIREAVEQCEIIFVAVGTPQGEDGSADLKYVLNVAADVGLFMNSDKIIVNKSTVPVGTAEKVQKTVEKELHKRKARFKVYVISNPEFLKEGTAIDDFMRPDRIIIGGSSEYALNMMQKLYSPFLRTDNRIYFMDNKSAEITKYAANSLLATKISFMNEIATLCDKVGANIDKVRVGIGSDIRIGQKFLFPGIGYGGSCFPKDVKALIKTGHHHEVPMDILRSVEEVNHRQKKFLFEKIKKYFSLKKQSLKGKTFAVWGLAFKPKTDDMREAPSIVVINHLLEHGAKVQAYDPVAMDNCRSIWDETVFFGKNAYEVLKGADALIIHTEWNEFRTPDFLKIKKLLKSPLIFDGRNIYNPDEMLQMDFEYFSIGR
ncbi:MAG: UDP-glucose/GDP-mannose dehydrogenase family protein [Candidatus Margulisbacteria bacterium]|nr:UDP-glucose/GDP-mannose dehydrogenase family protein [Candidatus Margulisiibacteriota bacterium]